MRRESNILGLTRLSGLGLVSVVWVKRGAHTQDCSLRTGAADREFRSILTESVKKMMKFNIFTI